MLLQAIAGLKCQRLYGQSSYYAADKTDQVARI